MNIEMKETDTFFDRHGEIVCITRIDYERIFGSDPMAVYHGVYCTGDQVDALNHLGEIREFRFSKRHMYDTYPRQAGDKINTSVNAAFSEAIFGQHVAHVTSKKGFRTAAIRPVAKGRFNITMSASKLEFTRDVHALTERQARHMVSLFIHGKAVSLDRPWYSPWINQAVREADIELDTLTPTRVRISYEMPNTGINGAWRKCTQVDNYIFIEV